MKPTYAPKMYTEHLNTHCLLALQLLNHISDTQPLYISLPNMVSDMHIGVLAFPFGTHAAPLLNLVRRLAAAAQGVKFSFINSLVSNKAINAERVSETYDNVKFYSAWDGTPNGFSGTHFEEVELFFEVSPSNFVKVIGEAESAAGLKITCFLTDAFLWFASDLAEERGVPWVPFWTAGSCSLSAHFYTDAIENRVESIGNEGTKGKTLLFIRGLSKVRFDDLPDELFVKKHPMSFAKTIYNVAQKLTKATIVVLNSFEEIDPDITSDLKSKFEHFLNIGPSILYTQIPTNPEDENECLPWLEKQNKAKSVIYISFGTVAAPPPNEIAALAEALEACQFPFLWTMKEHMKKFLPEGFLERTSERGKIVPLAPQLQVLQHSSVGLFITHCGWNSIMESISGGVPLICRPFFGDQKLNGRMVEDTWKIGMSIKGGVFSKTDTVNSLNHVLSSEEGKSMRENVSKLREKAFDAVKMEGSSTKNFNKLLEIISNSS